jgi:hypothetical protein
VLTRALSIASVAVAVGFAAGVATEASAYCRSTTCTGECARDELGCKIDGAKLFWASGCVGFSLQKDASIHIPMKYFRQVTEKSFVTWSQLECDTGLSSLAFSETEDVACHQTEYNSGGTNANIIMFQDTKWIYIGADNTLAKTTVTYDNGTGEIFDADIEVNHANNNFTINDDNVDFDLQAVMTHEIGHFMGFDHSDEATATMNAGYEAGTTDLRTLEFDDVAVACEVYPPERQVVCDLTPRGGLAYQCGGSAEKPPTDGGDDEGGTCQMAPVPAPLLGGIGTGSSIALAALFLRRRRQA